MMCRNTFLKTINLLFWKALFYPCKKLKSLSRILQVRQNVVARSTATKQSLNQKIASHSLAMTRLLTFFLLIFCVLFFKVNCLADQPSAQDIVSKIEQNFSKIENYRVDVSRIYSRSEISEFREEWRYFFENPGLARIEVMLPRKSTLVINQDDVWHYLAEEKKVVRRRIKDLEKKERILFLGRLLKPYEIEGWGLSISSKFGDRLKLLREEMIRGRKCYLIECSPKTDNPRQLKLLLWIDQERLAIIKKEIYKGATQLVNRTESENFLEVIPGVWLPRKVESSIHTEKGEVIKRLVLRNIKVNKSMPAKTFQFIPPEGCEVLTLNDKGEVVKTH